MPKIPLYEQQTSNTGPTKAINTNVNLIDTITDPGAMWRGIGKMSESMQHLGDKAAFVVQRARQMNDYDVHLALETRVQKNETEAIERMSDIEGKTGDDIIQMALAALEGNGDTPEEAEDKLKGKSMKEIAAIIKEELRQEMEAEKSERERISAEKQAEQDFKAQLTKVAESQAEKFPLVSGLGGIDHVYQMIVEDFDQKKKEFGEEYATENVMKASEAMKKVNDLLENNVKDALKSESVRRFVMNALKDGSFDQSKGNNQNNGDQGASTLSNSLHRKVTDPVDMRSMTDEEAFEAVFNYLK